MEIELHRTPVSYFC